MEWFRERFAIAPCKILSAEIVTAVEESISQLNDDQRHLVRVEVRSILRHTYKMLYSGEGLCPCFYGLLKIHKPGIPLRPIVSFVNFVNSPTMAISGYLAKILLPVVGNTDYTV